MAWIIFITGFCSLLLFFAATSDFVYYCRAKSLMSAIKRGDKCRVIGSTVGTYRTRNGLRSWMRLLATMKSLGRILVSRVWPRLSRATGRPAPRRWASTIKVPANRIPIRFPEHVELRGWAEIDQEIERDWRRRIAKNAKEAERLSEQSKLGHV